MGDFVIAATGVLHHPAYPDIDGLDSFAGTAFHSARWNHDVPLAGKRVGVIGTGSSAIQIVGALVDEVAELALFQRTAQWIMPMGNPAYSEDGEGRVPRRTPRPSRSSEREIARMFTDGFANHLADLSSPQLQAIHDACVANLENSVKDPVLREKLRPDYRAACKRLIMSENFYDAIQRPNARLVTEGIERVEKSGVRTRDGKLHELDVLVLATGFRVDRFMRPMEVVGRNGTALEEVWKDGPYAYMAISVPDFPNLFMLNGPNSPGRQLLPDRGRGAAVRVHPAARRAGPLRRVPRGERLACGDGTLRRRAQGGRREDDLEQRLQELVSRRPRSADGLAVDLRPLPGGDEPAAPRRLREEMRVSDECRDGFSTFEWEGLRDVLEFVETQQLNRTIEIRPSLLVTLRLSSLTPSRPCRSR